MGKAFTDQERENVREALRREGLRLLAQDGIRKVSIRELTGNVGIAQGGFYTFYRDKEEFVTDLILLRIREKTQLMLDNREESLKDPAGYLSDLFYREGMHLKANMAFNNRISGTIEFFMKTKELDEGEGKEIYRRFLRRMIGYWEENGYRISCDIDGIVSAGIMAAILFTNADMVPEAYFSGIYRAYCDAQVSRFMKVERV